MRLVGPLAAGALLVAAGCSDPVGPVPEGDVVLAFVSNRDGNDEIYALERNGAVVNLTDHAAHDRDPVWSPDGARLAFTRQTGTARDVVVLNLRSREVVDVSGDDSADDRDPSWAPGGDRLVFTSDRHGSDDVFSVRADGAELARLTHHPGPDRDAVFSPDGSHIAFTSGRDLRAAIYVMDVDGTGVERLTAGLDADDMRPRWHPSGDALAFERTADGASEIVRIDLPSLSLVTLTSDPAHDIRPRWSPDGERIVFLSNRDDVLWDVWTMRFDGAELRRISGAGIDRDARPAWSLDGREIAFESRRSGNWDVFVVDTEGQGLTALTTHGANDGAAAWRPIG